MGRAGVSNATRPVRIQPSVESWPRQRRDSRVFQEQSVLQIIETVFSAYAPLAAWRLADGVESFMRDAPVRSYCVQYRETDYAFVSRLLAEEGLGFCFVEAEGEAEGKAGSEQAGHEWLIFADTATLPEDYSNAQGRLRPDGAGIRFHRAASQESHDAVTALGAQRVCSLKRRCCGFLICLSRFPSIERFLSSTVMLPCFLASSTTPSLSLSVVFLLSKPSLFR